MMYLRGPGTKIIEVLTEVHEFFACYLCLLVEYIATGLADRFRLRQITPVSEKRLS